MKRPSTFGMTIRQLRDLFEVGRELRSAPGTSDDGAKRELLEVRLAESLPRPGAQGHPPPEGTNQLRGRTGSRAGDAIGEILKSPSSHLRTLKRVKRQAKYWAARAGSSAEHDAAAAVYYAAIAHALVHQDRRITRFPLSTLAQTYERLSRESWVTRELVALFQQAEACCLKKAASG